LKGRNFIVALLQVVIRDSRPNVVNVMEANIASEPLQYLRQLEIGATV
jgi:hypothetical protein